MNSPELKTVKKKVDSNKKKEKVEVVDRKQRKIGWVKEPVRLGVMERVKALAVKENKEQSFEEWKESRKGVGKKRKADGDDDIVEGSRESTRAKKSHLDLHIKTGSETLPEKETQTQGEGKKLETNKLFNKEGGAGHVRDRGGEEGGHEAGLGDPIGRRAPNTKNINWLSRLGEVRKKKA